MLVYIKKKKTCRLCSDINFKATFSSCASILLQLLPLLPLTDFNFYIKYCTMYFICFYIKPCNFMLIHQCVGLQPAQ